MNAEKYQKILNDLTELAKEDCATYVVLTIDEDVNKEYIDVATDICVNEKGGVTAGALTTATSHLVVNLIESIYSQHQANGNDIDRETITQGVVAEIAMTAAKELAVANGIESDDSVSNYNN